MAPRFSMPDVMLVTVGICTWNRADLLRRSLESFEHLQVPDGVEWELLVVDNNSTDSTRDVLASFSTRLPLRAIFEPRQGKSFACNTLLAEARGDVLFWTDDDACPDPRWIPNVLAALERHHADIVFGPVRPRWLSEAPVWFGRQFWSMFAILDHGPVAFAVTEDRHAFFGVNYAIRTDAMRRLGGMSEDFGPRGERGGGGEDMEFFRRARDAGTVIVYDPAIVVEHMIEPWRCTKSFNRRRAWRGSKTYFSELVTTMGDIPRILGVPRFVFVRVIGDVGRYVRAGLTGDRSEHFYREIKLIGFVGLMVSGLRWTVSGRRQQDSA